MADVQTASLYEQDFYLWALDQATALRRLRDAVAGQGDLAAVLVSRSALRFSASIRPSTPRRARME